MNRRLGLGLLFGGMLLGAILLWQSLAPHDSKGEARAQDQASRVLLRGARPEIRAEEFASLQAALDALPPEGGVVRLPPGTFEITQPLVIRHSDVLLQGSGTSSHIKNLNAAGEPALVVAHPDGEKVKNEDKLWRVMLSNFRITGNDKSGDGIEAILVNEIFVQGVTVSNHGRNGITLDRCYEDPRVNDCLITYNREVGLSLPGCHDIVVCGNQFEENRDAVHCTDAFNLCFTGNCVDDHLGDGVVIENTYGSVLSGNMIEECDGRAVVLARDCYGITLSANVIAHNGGGIDLVDAHGCAVSANTFVLLKTPEMKQEPIDTRCLKIGRDSGRIAVTGNAFCDSYIGEGGIKRKANDRNSGGIVLEGTRDVNITGNTFSSVPRALELGELPTSHVLFGNNLLTDTKSAHEELPKEGVTNNLTSP